MSPPTSHELSAPLLATAAEAVEIMDDAGLVRGFGAPMPPATAA